VGPKLTVLLTTYNHERFVEQALTSVVEQQTNFPFEVVVIEDCSTDATRRIVKTFADRYPDLVRPVLAPANENSNRLFAAEWARSQADYVAMLDGDDYWTAPDKLQRQVDLLDARPECALCFHDVLVIPEGTTHLERGRFTVWTERRLPELARLAERGSGRASERATADEPATIDPEALWAGCFIPGCSPLFRRRLVATLPDWFTDVTFGDWPLYLLLGELGPIAYLDEVMGAYRVHPDGLWSGMGPDASEREVTTFLERMLEVFPSHAALIRTELQARHRSREIQRQRSAALLAGRIDGDARAAVDALLARHVPANSAVIWVEPGLRPVAPERSVLDFPPLRMSWTLLSEAPQGCKSVSWIAPGYAYDFRLHGGPEPRAELAATTVVAESGGVCPAAGCAGEDASGKAYVTASPNPARLDGAHARTDVSWSTGDGSWGEVHVASYPLEEGLPDDGTAAIAALDAVRASGGQFLLIPPAAYWWLRLYPELESHLAERHQCLADDERAGRLYDLRT
jgi:hypothetical protein